MLSMQQPIYLSKQEEILDSALSNIDTLIQCEADLQSKNSFDQSLIRIAVADICPEKNYLIISTLLKSLLI